MLIKIRAANLSKKFNNLTIFKNLDFSLSISKSIAVTGDNGSGKSTLLEIIAGLQRPTSGKIIYEVEGKEAGYEIVRDCIGFCSLKINPYEELTAIENIQFVYKFEKNLGKKNGFAEILDSFLNRFDLYKDRNKQVKYYSSGMKQRLRFICAILHDPPVLILDEPGSNLDIKGRDALYKYIDSVRPEKAVIIATNQSEEAGLCDERIDLEK